MTILFSYRIATIATLLLLVATLLFTGRSVQAERLYNYYAQGCLDLPGGGAAIAQTKVKLHKRCYSGDGDNQEWDIILTDPFSGTSPFYRLIRNRKSFLCLDVPNFGTV